MTKRLEVHLVPEIREEGVERLHVLMAVWVAVVHPLQGRQYQNRVMEWGLGYADRRGDGASC